MYIRVDFSDGKFSYFGGVLFSFFVVPTTHKQTRTSVSIRSKLHLEQKYFKGRKKKKGKIILCTHLFLPVIFHAFSIFVNVEATVRLTVVSHFICVFPYFQLYHSTTLTFYCSCSSLSLFLYLFLSLLGECGPCCA